MTPIYEIISVGFTKDSPQSFPPGRGVYVPLVVESGKQYEVRHGLGMVPKSIMVAMADNYAQVKVISRDLERCVIVFNATANIILRVE
jgi:hypothetical protein